ncbi:hypothetical protein F383_14178 [Gossypium arboreum]|uniref:Uncharacterized protein n=1 Tax=Gossypium arboreum TaxID=29729 RepID=A0A0B0PLN9_GOSAR|nr:hypothetical protein F383_14178 [Gossypium arboreum]
MTLSSKGKKKSKNKFHATSTQVLLKKEIEMKT